MFLDQLLCGSYRLISGTAIPGEGVHELVFSREQACAKWPLTSALPNPCTTAC